jgi:hypothetical protein
MGCKTVGYRLTKLGGGDYATLRARPEGQRLYRHRRSAERAARRLRAQGISCRAYRVCACPTPIGGDAAGWDRYRLAHGYSGVHH